ncbi:glutamyl-tRNA(Gln) amidotransferase subunit A, mitochondrial [Chrysoperla carnea]|uniref:glutamyl-tRNA(Gln) amidotransferase subunit A, mitochondrial n=1 Tax=Chrysoperla carnea TaxID=189513 RepID=UPI001D0797FD|nr:glutamyl-tRNA(Gln) amidotransferase subunit A, mitochondrial [Chrysoperla carnea]
MNKLLLSSISVLNQVYKEKATGPVELVKACFDRIEKTECLNAYIKTTKDIAKKQACEANNRFTTGERLSALDGVPIAVKDNICTEGITTTCASKMLLNFVPTYNATVYKRLKDAGAILMGKTNMDEFAMGSSTIQSFFGPSKNPYGETFDDDNFYITGGSSGGSAVAVATGSCFAAIGSDTGGSVRNPASHCGVVGLKPTYGVISRYGLIPLAESLDTVGIFTRTINDCVIVFNHIAGPDDLDSTARKRIDLPIRLPTKPNLNGLKIGIPREFQSTHLMNEVKQTWDDVAKILKDQGAEVSEVSIPNVILSQMCYNVVNCCAISSNMARYDGIRYGHRAENAENSIEELYAKTRTEAFNDVVKSRIIAGNYFLLNENYEKYYVQATRLRRLIANDFDQVFENVHMMLTPTNLSTAPSVKEFLLHDDRSRTAMEDVYTLSANLVGVPALSIPIKLSKDKLPISIQLIGPNCSERALFSVAKVIEGIVKFPLQCLDNRYL